MQQSIHECVLEIHVFFPHASKTPVFPESVKIIHGPVLLFFFPKYFLNERGSIIFYKCPRSFLLFFLYDQGKIETFSTVSKRVYKMLSINQGNQRLQYIYAIEVKQVLRVITYVIYDLIIEKKLVG